MTGYDLCLGQVFTYHMVPQGRPKTESNEIAMVMTMLCKMWLAWQCCVNVHAYWEWVWKWFSLG